jgi:uncharacterized protein YnzC (UPF0291/DUF896 family)
MIVKVYNTNQYVILNKSDYTCLKHYYEEMMRIKFNKKLNSINVIDDLNNKLKQLKK